MGGAVKPYEPRRTRQTNLSEPTKKLTSMLSIKIVSKYIDKVQHNVLCLVENKLDGCGWMEVKELSNENILLISRSGYSPYIEFSNIPQDILNKVL